MAFSLKNIAFYVGFFLLVFAPSIAVQAQTATTPAAAPAQKAPQKTTPSHAEAEAAYAAAIKESYNSRQGMITSYMYGIFIQNFPVLMPMVKTSKKHLPFSPTVWKQAIKRSRRM